MVSKKKSLRSAATTPEVDQFLEKIKHSSISKSQGARGRLIFSMDATASRQATWDQAISLQHAMFTQTQGLASLDVQLVFYRGMLECRNSAWVDNADKLCALMSKVTCLAGRTQIERVFKHALAEVKKHPVNALVFVGDCMEEDADKLGDLAGQLKLYNVPVFVFQEGHDPIASQIFKQIAQLSGGAHCRFDQSSAQQLGQLLNAVAAFASGGVSALRALSHESKSAAKLLEQL